MAPLSAAVKSRPVVDTGTASRSLTSAGSEALCK